MQCESHFRLHHVTSCSMSVIKARDTIAAWEQTGSNHRKCGSKCKDQIQIEIYCKGQCLNPMKDKKNCGAYNSKSKKESKCIYGMCIDA
ncbi:hypothetical protein SLA2020_081360 [Shorea laevis]